MSVAGESADQVVRMSLEGMEAAIKVSGAAAERIIVLLFTILSQEKKTKGKARLSSMLRSGKELKVFTLPTKDLQAGQALRRHVLCSARQEPGRHCRFNDPRRGCRQDQPYL